MAARAIWKGSLSLGGKELPVKLYSAIEDKGVHFHLLEKRTHTRVKQHMVNPDNGKEVRNDEIRKGYEIEPGSFVIVDEEDLQKLEPKPSTSIEVAHFLPEGSIAHAYYDRPYFVGPDDDSKSYFALAEALTRQKREGLVHWIMRRKEYVGALRAFEGYLLLITLRHAEEVVSAREIGSLPGKPPEEREVKMAEQLVEVLADDFRAEDYTEDYRERVMKHIEARAKGRKPKLAVLEKPSAEPKSLLSALAASLKSTAAKGKEKAIA